VRDMQNVCWSCRPAPNSCSRQVARQGSAPFACWMIPDSRSSSPGAGCNGVRALSACCDISAFSHTRLRVLML